MMPSLVERIRGIIGKLPETGLYEPNVNQFQIFVKHMLAGVANSPRAIMLHGINRYFTEICERDIQARWLAVFVTDAKFRMKYQQSLAHVYETEPDITVSQYIDRTSEVINASEQVLRRDYQGNIYVMNLYHGIQRLTYGLCFRKYKSAKVICESDPIELTPGYPKLVETVKQTTEDETLREQRIARIIEDDRQRKEKAIISLPILEEQLKTSPQYQMWIHANNLWAQYGLNTRVDEFIQFDKEIGKQRNQRGIAFEYEKGNRAFLLVLRRLSSHAQIGTINCGTIDIPIVLIPPKYNEHLSRCSVDYGRIYPAEFVNTKTHLCDYKDWNISYQYVMGAEWKDYDDTHIGEIDLTCVIVFTRLFSQQEVFDQKIASSCNVTFNTIGNNIEVTVRQVIALIEMKSKCFEVNSAFKQHETKMTVQNATIDASTTSDFFSCSNIFEDHPTVNTIQPSFGRLNIWYSHKFPGFNPNPSIFVTTLIAENDFVIGLSGKVTLDVANTMFDDISIVDDISRLEQLMNRVRHKHSTYVSPMEIVTHNGHRILVIS